MAWRRQDLPPFFRDGWAARAVVGFYAVTGAMVTWFWLPVVPVVPLHPGCDLMLGAVKTHLYEAAWTGGIAIEIGPGRSIILDAPHVALDRDHRGWMIRSMARAGLGGWPDDVVPVSGDRLHPRAVCAAVYACVLARGPDCREGAAPG
jgi:hypothetical protein